MALKNDLLLHTRIWAYFSVVIMVLAVTLLGKAFKPPLDLTNIILLYLLPVLASAVWWGLWPSVAASFIGVLAFDFFFIPPTMSFSVANIRNVLDFALFLIVALVTGGLAARLRAEARTARERERRTAALYSFSQGVAGASAQEVLQLAVESVATSFQGSVAVFLPGSHYGTLDQAAWAGEGDVSLGPKERATAQLAFERGRLMTSAGGSSKLFFPITDGQNSVGVLAFARHHSRDLTAGQRQDIEAFMTVTALAVTRARLSAAAEQAKLLAESEKLGRSLLNAVSHDLKTPLSSIMGAVTGLLSQGDRYDIQDRATLLETIREGAHRMNRFITNLIDMARLESGMLKLNRQWCDLVDVAGVSLEAVEDILPEPRVHLSYPDSLPLVEADSGLIEQVMINLLENAAKYSPPESVISISISPTEKEIRVAVGDDGPTIPEEDRGRIFDKFYRLHSSKHLTGTGLGLSICKGIIESHGGRIWAEPGDQKGNIFIFALPVDPQAQPFIISESEEDYDQ